MRRSDPRRVANCKRPAIRSRGARTRRIPRRPAPPPPGWWPRAPWPWPCARRAPELDERTAPLAGLIAAFVFAVQMLNFPVAAGTSGHLHRRRAGRRPRRALDGGAVHDRRAAGPGAVVRRRRADRARHQRHPHGARHRRRRLRPCSACCWRCCRGRDRRRSAAPRSSAPSCPCPPRRWPSSAALRRRRHRRLPLGTVAAAMVGVHVLIGLGEAAITVAVRRRRPRRPARPRPRRPRTCAADCSSRRRRAGDARDRPARPGAAAPPDPRVPRRRPARRAAPRRRRQLLRQRQPRRPGVVGRATRASSTPPRSSATADSPLADYGVSGVDDGRLSGGLAGVIGVAVTLVIAAGSSCSSAAAAGPRGDAATERRTPRRPDGLTWAPATARSR